MVITWKLFRLFSRNCQDIFQIFIERYEDYFKRRKYDHTGHGYLGFGNTSMSIFIRGINKGTTYSSFKDTVSIRGINKDHIHFLLGHK